MDLNINSPAYFKEHYGADDEVYKFCQKAYVFFKNKDYSEILHTIGIVPVIAPKEIYDTGKWLESIKFLNNKSIVSIVIRMDFESYYNASSMEKLKQIKEMTLIAVKQIKSKAKFDYNKFMKDFLDLE